MGAELFFPSQNFAPGARAVCPTSEEPCQAIFKLVMPEDPAACQQQAHGCNQGSRTTDLQSLGDGPNTTTTFFQRNPAQGSLGASEFDPSFQQLGVLETPSQGPLEPRKGSQRPRRGSSGASERRVRFQRSGKTRWATQEAPKRSRFPGCFLRGFQPSGSYPQATDEFFLPPKKLAGPTPY